MRVVILVALLIMLCALPPASAASAYSELDAQNEDLRPYGFGRKVDEFAEIKNIKIKNVDIFPYGAKFVFEFDFNNNKNNNKFKIMIPGAFKASTVRFLNENINDVRVIVKQRDKWLPAALKGLDSAVAKKAAEISALNAKKLSLEQTLSLLDELEPQKENAQNLLVYIKEAEKLKLDAENELADIKLKIDDESKILNRLKKELDARMPLNAGSIIEISGEFDNNNKNNNIIFEAFTDNAAARWYPRYIMSLDTSTGEVRTRMYARLSQRTGLDYDGLITFHTKYPDEKITRPVIRPLKVGLMPKRARNKNNYYAERAAGSAMMMNKSVAMEDIRALEAEEDEAPEFKAVPATPIMSATLSDNAVQGNGAVTGDGVECEFSLGNINLTGKTELVLIPDQRSSAWIIVNFDDITTPLIPGKAELFVDGYASGVTDIPEYGIGRSEMPFGYAPQITAKKEAMVEKTGSSWLSGNVFANGYIIQVTNSTPDEKLVTVRDRLPVPTDDKIKLDVRRIEPKPDKRDDENKLTWKIPVKSGETVKIMVDYTLGYPSDETLEYK